MSEKITEVPAYCFEISVCKSPLFFFNVSDCNTADMMNLGTRKMMRNKCF